MKKFVKLSLAAAVASTGLVSANAGALEDAIKNTSILGYATYRYDDRTQDAPAAAGGNNDAFNRHKIALGLISKINDDLSYTYVGAVATGEEASSAPANAVTGIDNQELTYFGGSLFTVYNYFTYTGINNVTVNVGQQTIDTPQTDTYDDIGATQEGTGITASTTIGGFTVAAGAMNQTKLSGEGNAATTLTDGSEDLMVIAVKGKVANIALDANYIDLKDAMDSYTIGAKTSLDVDSTKVSLKARYTALSIDNATNQALWYVGAAAKMGPFGLTADYIKTGKDGGRVAFDDDAEAVNQGWALNLNDTNVTGDMVKVGASYALTSELTLSALHVAKSMDVANTDADETLGQLTWKPSKNFYAYLRYGTVDADGGAAAGDGQRGRVHMTYKF